MNIEIRKVQASSTIDVYVDGERWATGYKNSRGMHGYFYEFRDSLQRGVYKPGARSEWQVWSDKIAARRAGISKYGDVQIKPFAERLPEEIKKMIAESALRSPAECRAESEARMKRYEESERKAAEARDRLLGIRADEVLEGAWFTTELRDSLKAKIIEAMKWAQSQ